MTLPSLVDPDVVGLDVDAVRGWFAELGLARGRRCASPAWATDTRT